MRFTIMMMMILAAAATLAQPKVSDKSKKKTGGLEIKSLTIGGAIWAAENLG